MAVRPVSAPWAARHQEGYITRDGEWIEVGNSFVPGHGWGSPQAAQSRWMARGDFELPGVTRYLNGKQHIDDVSERPEFVALGVTHSWRRITFEQATSAAISENAYV